MANSLAEMMLAQTSQSQQNQSAGLAESFQKGAQLAMQKEQNEMAKAQVVQKQQELQNAKLTKWWDAVSAAQMNKDPRARRDFIEKSAPRMRDALGLGKEIPDDFIGTLVASEENLSKAETLNNMFANGEISHQQLVSVYNDPVAFANVQPTPSFAMGAEAMGVADASKTRINADARRAEIQGQNYRQQVDIGATGQKALATKSAASFDAYNNLGGRAGVDKNISKIEEAIAKLKKGPNGEAPEVKLGTLAKNLPFGSDESVLARLDPAAKALVDDVRGSVNMRAALADPNPTEKQISQLLARTIDPRLSNEANIKKLQDSLNAMRQEVGDKEKEFQRQGFIPRGGGSSQATQGQAPAAAGGLRQATELDDPAISGKLKTFIGTDQGRLSSVAAKYGMSPAMLQKLLGGQ